MLVACVSEQTHQQADIAHLTLSEQRGDFASDTLFPEGGYQLSANGKRKLNAYVTHLKKLQNDAVIVVFGHTDNVPVEPSLQQTGIVDNIDLSSRQAENVVAYLVSQGVDPRFIVAKGFGDANPVASNDAPQGRAQNRRIEFRALIEEGRSRWQSWPPPGPGPKSLETAQILASRLFAGPTQYPPNDFAAYGILVFKTRATSDDTSRYEMICNAYVAGLLHVTDVKVPLKQQMVTVWPIESDSQAFRVNKMPRESLCSVAVRSYGLPTSLEAIGSARRSSVRFDDTGPFLLAWSPSETKGQPDALVLVSDLSDVTTSEQAKQIFFDWFSKIQQNPELWRRGWDIAKLKVQIRLWADKYGEKLLNVVGVKS
jgi:outer membrane protein OmpA-like peptidoglycan-associated protein